jgi:hypothetical protein
MTQEQKNLLQPFAEIIANIHIRLAEMDPSEQHELLKACDAANGVNCWCLTYDAAKLLKPELQMLLSGRAPTRIG